MNAYDNIDYRDYTLNELYQSRAGVDKNRYPNNAANIDYYIQLREGSISEETQPPERITAEKPYGTEESSHQRKKDASPLTPPRKIDKYPPVTISNLYIFRIVTGYIRSSKANVVEQLKYPGLALLLTSYLKFILADDISNWMFWVNTILYIYFVTIFAVRCHRMVLLEEQITKIKDSLIWRMRETNFLLNEVSIGLLSFLPVFLLILLGSFILVGITDSKLLWLLFSVIVGIVGGYMFSRMVLILPAVAIDRTENFSSWETSKRYVWEIFTLVVFVPSSISFVSDKCIEFSSYFIIVAPFIQLSMLFWGIISLSIIYKEITISKET